VLATITNGEITDTEWRTAFSLNAAQWNNVKTTLTGWANSLATVNGAAASF
jgi:hypothetical protein